MKKIHSVGPWHRNTPPYQKANSGPDRTVRLHFSPGVRQLHLLSEACNSVNCAAVASTTPSRSVCPVSPRPTKDAQHCTVPRGFSSHSTLLPRTPRLLQAEAKVLHPPHPQGVFPTARTYAKSPSPTWSFSHYFRLFHYHPIMESLTPLSQLFWGTAAHTAPRLWTESINVCALLTCWQGTH